MTPEDISAFLKDMPIKALIDALSILDPDVVRVIESIELVRGQGYGKVTVTVANRVITEVAPEVKYRLR